MSPADGFVHFNLQREKKTEGEKNVREMRKDFAFLFGFF